MFGKYCMTSIVRHGLPTEKGAGLSTVHVQGHMTTEKGAGLPNCTCADSHGLLIVRSFSFSAGIKADRDSLYGFIPASLC